MRTICVNCIVDKTITSSAVPMIKHTLCMVCGQKTDIAFDIDDRATKELFRALLRYHYHEWEYNEHIGGDGIFSLLARDNNLVANTNEEAIEDICCTVFEEGYECDSIGVSLFADGDHLPPLRALRDDDDPFLQDMRKRLLKTNYFDLIPFLREILEPLCKHFDTICDGLSLARARIGYEKRAIKLSSWEDYAYLPYTGENLGSPPPPLATAGRINRPGVSFLYLASDADTAVMEIRPHPGHIVSVGGFRQIKQCAVANFHKINIGDLCHSDEQLREYRFLRTIERDLSSPVIPEERSRYLLGQLVADVLMNLGFGGVAYQSSVNPSATNYCFFDPASFEYIDDTALARKIRSLAYWYVDIRSILALGDDYVEI